MDHEQIVFTRFNGDGTEMFNDLYAIDPEGKNETRLTTNPGPNAKRSGRSGFCWPRP